MAASPYRRLQPPVRHDSGRPAPSTRRTMQSRGSSIANGSSTPPVKSPSRSAPSARASRGGRRRRPRGAGGRPTRRGTVELDPAGRRRARGRSRGGRSGRRPPSRWDRRVPASPASSAPAMLLRPTQPGRPRGRPRPGRPPAEVAREHAGELLVRWASSSRPATATSGPIPACRRGRHTAATAALRGAGARGPRHEAGRDEQGEVGPGGALADPDAVAASRRTAG